MNRHKNSRLEGERLSKAYSYKDVIISTTAEIFEKDIDEVQNTFETSKINQVLFSGGEIPDLSSLIGSFVDECKDLKKWDIAH